MTGRNLKKKDNHLIVLFFYDSQIIKKLIAATVKHSGL